MSGEANAGRGRGEGTIPLKTWIAVGGSLIGAFMAVLNIQVTNSSLPNIEGGIGTGGVNGAWISTAYLIGEIIVIPMTDFLGQVFSIRRYLIASTGLFLILSIACGLVSSLPEMIVLRGLQGFFGGVMIPLAFTIIVTMLPPSKRPLGFAGFAVTATFAPAIGPTIGGWLTDTYGWPTIFFMNLVPGTVMLGALIYSLPNSKAAPGLIWKGDWLGIGLMAIGLASLQTILDDGNVDDWFSSQFIVQLSIISAITLSGFVVVELVSQNPLMQLRLLMRRNFGLGTLSNFLLGFALYASAYLLPQYLAVGQGFDAQQSGEVMAWTGLPQLLLIPFMPRLMRRFDSRLLVAFGFIVFAASCFMNLHLDMDYSGQQLFWPDVTRALGQALVMTPLTAIAMVGIATDEAGPASGLFNMMRNLGGAIGTAMVETFFTKREQYHSFIINTDVSMLQPATQARVSSLQNFFITHGVPDGSLATAQAVNVIGETVRVQATFMAYADCFALLGCLLTAAAFLIMMLKKGGVNSAGAH